MKYKVWAKSNPKRTIKEHTDDLLRMFDNLCSIYSKHFTKEELELLHYAILVHDLGKMNSRFQNKLFKAMGENKRIGEEFDEVYMQMGIKEIPHGFLSAAFLDINLLLSKYGLEYTEAIVTAVYNHHTREDSFSDVELLKIVERDLSKQAELYGDFEGNINIHKKYIKYNRLKNSGSSTNFYPYKGWLKYVLIKGILNRLDYAASSKEVHAIEISPEWDGKNIGSIVKDTLLTKHHALRDVQSFMSNNKDKNLVVIASTGIGKTEAALLWLDNSKGFYTLPLKVSINAIYKRILDKYNYPEEKITLLHSGALSYYIENTSEKEGDVDPFLRYNQARLLSYPLTVCTVDQLFRFVYKDLGSEVFPATLKYSKLIIDEIQMYTPGLTACLLFGLKVISDLGGRFAIITATFPPVLGYFLKECKLEFEQTKPFYISYVKRHFIQYFACDFDYDIIEEVGKKKKVLVLCNTVKKAQEVYNILNKKQVEAYLLHSRFIQQDRERIEEKLLAFSEEKESIGVWVSTQIVEASLDIDFDFLYTEMCSADSLLQRLGRCFRKRNYDGTSPNVYIYDTGNGVGRIYDKDIYRFSVDFIKKYSGKIFTEEDKQQYINEVYDIQRVKETDYYKTIWDKLNTLESMVPAIINSVEAAKKLREIDSIIVMPDKIYHELLNTGSLEVLKDCIEDKTLHNYK